MRLVKDDEHYAASRVTVHVDDSIINLEVEDNETVFIPDDDPNLHDISEELKAAGWETLDEPEEQYAIRDMSVSEAEEYVDGVDSVEELKELRKKEGRNKDRKTAVEAIDSKIKDLKQQEAEEEQDEEEDAEEDGSEDGEETEDE